MKLALIGVGQAGGKIVDKLLWYDQETGSNFARSATAINTAKADLVDLDYIPQSDRHLIGQSRVKGHGVGADNELGAEIAQEDVDEIQGALDDVPVHDVDAFLVVAALGGGTGSGAGPVIINHLKQLFTEPVYGLGVLPAQDEGRIYTLNAARSFKTFVREADNLLVVDNDAWRQTGESLEKGFAEINEEIARRFGILFSAGELSTGEVAENVVDSSEIINTLDGGGITSVGYAVEPIEEQDDGLLSRFSDSEDEIREQGVATNRITSLIRKATLGRLTLPCEIQGVERALVVVGGPPETLSRKGIEQARKWIEEQTGSMEVRGGDYPIPGESKVAGVVVLSGLKHVPRIDELQEQAVDAQDKIEEKNLESESNVEDLMSDDLETLF